MDLKLMAREKTAIPQSLPDHQWNCSVPFFPQFKLHLQCNLRVECPQGEDESQCPYPACTTRGVSIGDGCYTLTPYGGEVKSREASQECRRLGGHLVSFNTDTERQQVRKALRSHVVGEHRTHVAAFLTLNMHSLYRQAILLEDLGIMYTSARTGNKLATPVCGFSNTKLDRLVISRCEISDTYSKYICEFENPEHEATKGKLNAGKSIALSPVSVPLSAVRIPMVVCPAKHLTHAFLACDSQAHCHGDDDVKFGETRETWDVPSSLSCSVSMTSLPPSWACADGLQRVPYSLLCDYGQDCQDNSDEDFCEFPPSQLDMPLQCGSSSQMFPPSEWCNTRPYCRNDYDELDCDLPDEMTSNNYDYHVPKEPIIVKFEEGRLQLHHLRHVTDCPDTHFTCVLHPNYCMPVFVRCNGVYDCPGKEDELGCSTYTCPGYYRCRSSSVCLHPSHVCDSVHQCPQYDDETLCDLVCPDGCTCHGLAFTCTERFGVDLYVELRYLSAGGSGIRPEQLTDLTMLIHLSLADCGLEEMGILAFPNLHSLDISRNKLTDVSVTLLRKLRHIRVLYLVGNPLSSLFQSHATEFVTLEHLRTLDLSHVEIKKLNTTILSPFPGLRSLNMSYCGLQHISPQGFQTLKRLRHLDLTGCPFTTFPAEVFGGLNVLQTVQTENYRLCCPIILPENFNLANCHAPANAIASCEDLLPSDIYRAVLAVFATLTLVGNMVSVVFRLSVDQKSNKAAFLVLVGNLCMSDFLMGVYLATVGLADNRYRGAYLWNDLSWQQSSVCQAAGYLALLSSEVSAFLICLITLDRFLVLRFPFSQFHFHYRSAWLACVSVWAVGLGLAALPLVPALRHWRFYSRTGLCAPLPVTGSDDPGHNYTFGVVIVVNFVLFVVIAVGQASIFLSIRSNSMLSADSSRASRDLNVARRLITIAVSDFVCWFPIGLVGLLAAHGMPVSAEINVGMAIFALPLNSAINPFLYTLNIILERRRTARDEKIMKTILDTMKQQ